jgi:hypothetical protein
MSISVQLRRGTSTQNNSFTGSVGEVVYTTDTKDLYVHDGSTLGGKLVGGGAASIADGSLTTAKLANGAVTTDKLAADAVTPAKTSFLGTVDEAADTVVAILSKQSDGEYDSVTPSGDVTMTQAGAFTIATDAVTTGKIDDGAVTSAKLATSLDFGSIV